MSSKKPAGVAPKQRAKPRAKAASPKKPYLRFYHSESLRAKTLDILARIEKAKDGKPHREALANVVVELTGSGMDYFFLNPLKLAKSGFVVQQSAGLGISAATGMMASAIRTIIGRMEHDQLLVVCGFIRQLME